MSLAELWSQFRLQYPNLGLVLSDRQLKRILPFWYTEATQRHQRCCQCELCCNLTCSVTMLQKLGEQTNLSELKTLGKIDYD